MGNSSYDSSVYSKRIDHHRATGTSAFTHSSSIDSGAEEAKVHAKLDPSKANNAGLLIRESFDSPAHPASTAVAVLFDVTGSMADVPRTFIEQLGTLMQTLTKKGYLPDPQVLFGAIGDATSDRVPLQIGQFEAGNEMDEALSLVYLEGAGGGQNKESYELAMYYMARHVDMNCLTKRNKKGYLFITGDELPYPEVKKSEVKRVIGDSLEVNIPIADMLKELREKFEVFWIMPKGTSNWGRPDIEQPLRKLFGQNFLKLENPASVSELICATIGVWEGRSLDDIGTEMKDAGASTAKVKSAVDAVADLAAARNLAGAGTDKIARL
jgi:hypothetical protein